MEKQISGVSGYEDESAGVLFFVGFGDGNLWHPMLRYAMAHGYRGEAQDHRKGDVCQGSAPCVGTDQVEGLEAEGGEGGESTADADHDEEADVIGGGESAAVQGERAEVADDEGTDHVDENRADGKADADIEGEHQPADGVAQEAAKRTADRNPEIRHRLPRSSSYGGGQIGRGHQPGCPAVLGDLIPVTGSYNMTMLIQIRRKGFGAALEAAVTWIGDGLRAKSSRHWFPGGWRGQDTDRLHGQMQSLTGRGAPLSG